MPKRRKKSSNSSTSKFIMVMTSVAMLNAMGISYAYWNDDLSINTYISTGKMDASFCEQRYSFKSKNGNVLSGEELDVSFPNSDTIEIQGTVDSKYNASFHYCVVNKSNLPIEFVKENFNEKDGLKLMLTQQAGILKPGDYSYSETGNPKLEIKAEKPGTYEFEIKLKFRQKTR